MENIAINLLQLSDLTSLAARQSAPVQFPKGNFVTYETEGWEDDPHWKSGPPPTHGDFPFVAMVAKNSE